MSSFLRVKSTKLNGFQAEKPVMLALPVVTSSKLWTNLIKTSRGSCRNTGDPAGSDDAQLLMLGFRFGGGR